MQTREQQIELAIAVRIGELRRLAQRTTEACEALRAGKLPRLDAASRDTLLRHLLQVARRRD